MYKLALLTNTSTFEIFTNSTFTIINKLLLLFPLSMNKGNKIIDSNNTLIIIFLPSNEYNYNEYYTILRYFKRANFRKGCRNVL